ncbi:hypothetical protein CS023_09390 [Shewanella xiamenensis]|nr:hypothetical protein ABT47_10695 [Shewanella xiamenensis]PHY62113.1 hypothetical protein CS023_09390 [Shewanella xiamenensis]
MKISDFRAYEREVGTAELGALHGCKAHPSEAIANLAMSTRGFQLRWGVLEHPRRIGRAVLLGRVWGEAPRL